MTPQEMSQRIEQLEKLVAQIVKTESQYITLKKIIYHTGSKAGFFSVTPVAQQSAITSPSGGGSSSTDAIDISARTAIGQIKTALQNLGLTA